MDTTHTPHRFTLAFGSATRTQPRKVWTPRFNIEPCRDYSGATVFIVRFKGAIVTTVAASETQQQARDKAAHYWRVVRSPDKLTHIETPF